jgi:NADH-quinone oxidoreductase subunit N
MMPSLGAGAFAPLAPFLILAVGGLVVLLLDALIGRSRRIHWVLLSAPIPILAILAYALRWSASGGPTVFGEMALDDAFGGFVGLVVCLSTLFAIVLSETYLRKMERYRGDYFALLLFSASGMVLFASSSELLTLFLGLELLSVPVYILTAFLRTDPKSVEASMKYFLLGAFSSAIFLFGGALIYAATGHTDLSAAFGGAGGGVLRQIGALLLLSGFLFKIAAVPFHMWTPDVYEGAPTAVTAFMAAGVKAAAFGAFGRIIFLIQPLAAGTGLATLLWWLAVLTMTVGNAAALTQSNIKRMLAYSSIAHAGYMLIGVAVFARTGDTEALSGILYYLLAYALMNIGAFAVVILWGEQREERLEIGEYAGLGWKSPGASLALSIFMISLSGIPPTAGFFGKYYIFRNAVQHGFGGLVVIAVLNSALSVYYYLRVLVALYMRPLDRPLPARPSWLVGAVVTLCAVAVLWIGFAPDAFVPGVPSLLGLVRDSVVSLR